MDKQKTKVLSFRVPEDVAEKVDEQVKKEPLGGRQKLIEGIFIPAFNKFVRKAATREKEVAAQ